MTRHCGLTVVEQLTFPSPTIYACISLHFHIWELVFFRVEGVGGEGMVRRTEDGETTEWHLELSGLSLD